uniref:WAS/WASL interacting protein family member 2 n=1 Tax=Poecilia formosa TaxID=48698 RepID=A0A096LXC2_POEFO
FPQANTTPPKLNSSEAKGRGALLSDICKGAKLKKVTEVNDRSAPVLDTFKKSNLAAWTTLIISTKVGMGALFQGGVPKLRPVGDGSAFGSVGRSALRPPGSRPAAPRPPSGGSTSPNLANKPSSSDHQRSHRPSLPDISRPAGNSSSSGGMKHSTSAPPPPPPFNKSGRGNAPPTPNQKGPSYNRDKVLPPTPSRGSSSSSSSSSSSNVRSNHSSSKPPSGGSSMPPPPPPYRPSGTANGPSQVDSGGAPELPQRKNSLRKKQTSGGGGQGRNHAPPPPMVPPSSSQQVSRPPPPAREPPGRKTAPQLPPSSSRNGGRDAPPPPPYRGHSTGVSEQHGRVKPLPPPSPSPFLSSSSSRTPAGPPPPPPPFRNGHSTGPSSKSIMDDFESKFNFHPIEDLPPPEEFRPSNRTYPSKSDRGVMRGAPPAPPVGR